MNKTWVKIYYAYNSVEVTLLDGYNSETIDSIINEIIGQFPKKPLRVFVFTKENYKSQEESCKILYDSLLK